MDTNDKNDYQVRMMKPDAHKARRKRVYAYAIIVILAAVVIISLGRAVYDKVFPNHSQKLISQVTELGNGKHTCVDGVKQVNPVAPQLANSSTYNNAARETALNYLMSCSFEAQNTQQALKYAAQLKTLYIQDGSKSAQKLQDLAVFERYMMNYSK